MVYAHAHTHTHTHTHAHTHTHTHTDFTTTCVVGWTRSKEKGPTQRPDRTPAMTTGAASGRCERPAQSVMERTLSRTLCLDRLEKQTHSTTIILTNPATLLQQRKLTDGRYCRTTALSVESQAKHDGARTPDGWVTVTCQAV